MGALRRAGSPLIIAFSGCVSESMPIYRVSLHPGYISFGRRQRRLSRRRVLKRLYDGCHVVGSYIEINAGGIHREFLVHLCLQRDQW